jgi:glycosyltransferase involved in cell wall biosynthesis
MKRLAIVATHPVQYNVPWFRLLADHDDLTVRVFYTWQAHNHGVFDPDFSQTVKWDVPLLDGYDYELATPHQKVAQKSFWNINADAAKPIERWSPDGILLLGWNYLSHLRVMRHFHDRVPVYFRGDSTILDDQSSLRRVARRNFLSQIYKFVDTAFYVGSNNYDYFRLHGLQDTQLCFAPHAVDNEHFATNDVDRTADADVLRRSLGIGTEDVVFLFAAKLIEKKDPMLLLRSFMKLQRTDAHLVIVGSGPLESNVRHASESEHNVHLLPFKNQSEMPVIYRLGDIACVPSRGPGETWGLAVNEAMASARPAIASDRVGCARDLLSDTNFGYIHKSGNLCSLASVMAQCLNRDQLRRMGRECQEFVLQHWSLEQLASAIADRVNSSDM